MSISSARTFIEKSGCGVVVSVALGLVIVFGLIFYNLGSRRADQGPPPEMLQPVAVVGTQPVSAQAVSQHYDAQAAQQLTPETKNPVELSALIFGSQLEGLIQQAARLELAARKGVKITEDDVVKWAGANFDMQIQQAKFSLQISGKVKAGATEAEINQALAKELGGDVNELRTKQIEQIQQKMSEDPIAKSDIEGAVIGQKLLDAYSAQVQLSDDQLKKDQVATVFKRISLKVNKDFKAMSALEIKEKEEELVQKADQVYQQIKGGLSFEAAMDRYSDDPEPASGKKKSDATVNLQRSALTFDPDYAPLVDLKPGEVSPVIYHAQTGEYLIFKAISYDSKLPTDFEKNKANYRKNRLNQLATIKINDEAKKLIADDNIKWKSAGFKVLYHWYKVYGDMDLLKTPAKRLEKLEEVSKEAKKVVADPDTLGGRPATLAYFASLDRVYRAAGPEKKKSLQEDWADAAAHVLENIESTDLRLELAAIYLDTKKIDEAKAELSNAASGLAGSSDETFSRFKKIQDLRAKLAAAGVKPEELKDIDESQRIWKEDAVESLKGEAEDNLDYSDFTGKPKFADINKRLEKLKAFGLIKPEDVKIVEGFQDKWKKEKAKFDDEQAAQRKKDQEAAKKAAEDAKKKAAEDAKKKPAPSAAPSSTTTKPPSSNDLTKIGGG